MIYTIYESYQEEVAGRNMLKHRYTWDKTGYSSKWIASQLFRLQVCSCALCLKGHQGRLQWTPCGLWLADRCDLADLACVVVLLCLIKALFRRDIWESSNFRRLCFFEKITDPQRDLHLMPVQVASWGKRSLPSRNAGLPSVTTSFMWVALAKCINNAECCSVV